jgi:hypothetical protein
MKKLAIGCAVLFVILVAGGAGASYFVYRKVSSTVSGFAELRKVPELERAVRNRSAFTPPASGEISRDQLQRYLAVQQRVAQELGERRAKMERTYAEYLEHTDQATIASLPQLVSAYRDLATAYMAAKRVQVDALNGAGFSLSEYRWIRTQAYAALGMPMPDQDVLQIIDEVRQGQALAKPVAVRAASAAAPAATRALLEPHRKVIEHYAPLAFFGL